VRLGHGGSLVSLVWICEDLAKNIFGSLLLFTLVTIMFPILYVLHCSYNVKHGNQAFLSVGFFCLPREVSWLRKVSNASFLDA